MRKVVTMFLVTVLFAVTLVIGGCKGPSQAMTQPKSTTPVAAPRNLVQPPIDEKSVPPFVQKDDELMVLKPSPGIRGDTHLSKKLVRLLAKPKLTKDDFAEIAQETQAALKWPSNIRIANLKDGQLCGQIGVICGWLLIGGHDTMFSKENEVAKPTSFLAFAWIIRSDCPEAKAFFLRGFGWSSPEVGAVRLRKLAAVTGNDVLFFFGKEADKKLQKPKYLMAVRHPDMLPFSGGMDIIYGLPDSMKRYSQALKENPKGNASLNYNPDYQTMDITFVTSIGKFTLLDANSLGVKATMGGQSLVRFDDPGHETAFTQK